MQGRIAFISNQDDGYIDELFPGQEDRGANDHYALRGRIAWQPTEDTDVDLILRYLRADRERQAGLYSHEPACPNAQRQGEFTPPTLDCPFWLGGEGATGTGFRNDAIIPSRGGDPWATEESSLSYVDRTIKAATLRIDSQIGDFGFVSITDYQKADKFYTEGGDASPDLGVVFYQGSDLTQYSEELRLSGDFGSNHLVGGLYFMNVDGDYTGQFADPFYADIFTGCVPDCAYVPVITASQETTSFAVFLQNEWEATDKLEPDRRPALLARRTRGRVLRRRAEQPNAHRVRQDPGRRHRVRCSVRRNGRADHADAGRRDADVRRLHRAPRARLSRRTTTCSCSRASIAAARAADSRSRPARHSPISRPSRRSGPTRSS